MGQERLQILLDAPSLKRVRAGEFNFFNRLMDIVQARGWSVEVTGNSPTDRADARKWGGPTLLHMEEPTHAGALTCRRAYIGAFWRIEAEHERWNWPVARAEFQPNEVDAAAAGKFFQNWRRWAFDGARGVGDDGFVLVPLQGRLLENRSFQSMSPVRMIDHVLKRTDMPVLATLHPRETYTPEEIDALKAMAKANPRLEVEEASSDLMLRRCSFVVTQNSSLAFKGYFLEKPAVLFAEIDFWHIAGSVPHHGLEAAFEHVKQQPDYARYLHWFLTSDTVNAGQEAFEETLPEKLRSHGWNI
ncbi:hypothetical protein [Vannielia litorea]|uniref:hypothetical protein n=1 Tax=Vannielia litorea TaxID=1217970 RepID=UPI001BD02DE2|nr:hypothetical protein [Vannielia litorea]MBS8224880.1 hypothetical protein [Vannielia litorea]